MPHRRAVIVACLLALASAGVSAQAAPPSPELNVAIFTRVAPDGLLAADYGAGNDGRKTSGIGCWFLDNRRRLITGGLSVTSGGYQAPEAGSDGTRASCGLSPVRPAPVCESRVGGASFGRFRLESDKDPEPTRLIVAYFGDPKLFRISLTKESRGWRLERRHRSIRVLRTSDGDGTYVTSASEGAELMGEAQLPGGRSGSLAVASVPCRTFAGGFSSGRGEATLAGGTKSVNMACPTGPTSAAAQALAATTWQLSGSVVGVTASGIQATSVPTAFSTSGQDVRLVAVDGPF